MLRDKIEKQNHLQKKLKAKQIVIKKTRVKIDTNTIDMTLLNF
jgi:hypothetical protein